MRINIIGGGPAGLYFALLMKRHEASHEVTVFERNPPDATFGWGVVFSGRTLSNLREADDVSHLRLLNILQERCDELGVELRFRTEVEDIEALAADCDLVVGADGVGSLVRERYSEDFRPVLACGRNKYIWYGTRRLFHGLTLTFRESDAGVFAAHSYK